MTGPKSDYGDRWRWLEVRQHRLSAYPPAPTLVQEARPATKVLLYGPDGEVLAVAGGRTEVPFGFQRVGV